MVTVIQHNTFFQIGLRLTAQQRSVKMVYQPGIDQLLRKQHIYTRFNSRASRLKIGTDQAIWGADISIEPYTTFGRGQNFFSMGAFSYSWSQLPVNTVVGRYTSIGSRVSQMGHNHPLNRFTTSSVSFDGRISAYRDYLNTEQRHFRPTANPQDAVQPIVIGNDVLIGDDVVFGNNGLVISDGAVVAAGSLVTHDVPPYAVVAGWPARVVKYRFDFPTIDQLLDLRWWQYDFGLFTQIAADEEITAFIAKVGALVAEDQLPLFSPQPLTTAMVQKAMEARSPVDLGE